MSTIYRSLQVDMKCAVAVVAHLPCWHRLSKPATLQVTTCALAYILETTYCRATSVPLFCSTRPACSTHICFTHTLDHIAFRKRRSHDIICVPMLACEQADHPHPHLHRHHRTATCRDGACAHQTRPLSSCRPHPWPASPVQAVASAGVPDPL